MSLSGERHSSLTDKFKHAFALGGHRKKDNADDTHPLESGAHGQASSCLGALSCVVCTSGVDIAILAPADI